MTAILKGDLTPDWFDQVAVNRALNGLPVGRKLHKAERRHIARTLVAHGHGSSMIAKLAGCSGREAMELDTEARAALASRQVQVS